MYNLTKTSHRTITLLFTHSNIVDLQLTTVEPPFNVHQFKGFSHLVFNFNDLEPMISVLIYAHLKFSSV